MQDLSIEKSMNGQEMFFLPDDLSTIITHRVQKNTSYNNFRFLHDAYVKAKNNILSKNVDVEEILNYIISYFSILFTSPDALELQTTATVQQVRVSGTPSMPNMPPGMGGENAQMMQMLQQMLMQSQGQGRVFEETFTNIENDFYQCVAEEGLIISDKEFMGKVLEEECKYD